MKSFFVVLMASSMLVCSCSSLNQSGHIICNKKRECKSFILSNGLSIRFKYVDYFFSRRNVVSFICDIENHTDKRLIFDQQPFSIVSNEYKYSLMPQTIHKKWWQHSLDDTVVMEPGKYENLPLNFKSKNKMSRKEFQKFYASDTLKLMFANGDKTDTLFAIVGTKDE